MAIENNQKNNYENLKSRTRAFALRVVRVVDSLPRTRSADIIGRQLLRSATSVGANYRSACRARSAADFIAKIVEEEADEAVYWMELLVETKSIASAKLTNLMVEGNELVAIAVSSIKTARRGTEYQRQISDSRVICVSLRTPHSEFRT